MAIERSVEVTLAPELLRIFFPLLQEGVEIEVETGCSVKELLTGQLGISAEYIAKRITTLFLNHRAVDNTVTSLVHDGAVLALSGAMPGLVGATMRSGGYYAAMRGAMTYHEDSEVPIARTGRIRLKLFNLLLDELGARVLGRGILIAPERLRDFFGTQPETFRPRGCWLDGRKIPPEQFLQETIQVEAGKRLQLKVYFRD